MWLPIVGFENLYEVSCDGVVRSAKSGREIPKKSGKVTLSKKGCVYVLSVDSIVNESVTDEAKNKYENSSVKEKAFLRIDLNNQKNKPWKQSNPSKIIGDIGEHLVCVELLSRGVRAGVNLLEGSPYDVIGDFGNGYIFKIQVKTLPGPKDGEYRFSSKGGDYLKTCDVMAYVSLTDRTAVFCLCSECQTASRFFKETEFNMLSGQSIDYVLDKLHSRFERQMVI